MTDSNRRYPARQAGALSHYANVPLVGVVGFEPTISHLSGECFKPTKLHLIYYQFTVVWYTTFNILCNVPLLLMLNFSIVFL